MRGIIYILTILALGFALSVNAQSYKYDRTTCSGSGSANQGNYTYEADISVRVDWYGGVRYQLSIPNYRITSFTYKGVNASTIKGVRFPILINNFQATKVSFDLKFYKGNLSHTINNLIMRGVKQGTGDYGNLSSSETDDLKSRFNLTTPSQEIYDLSVGLSGCHISGSHFAELSRIATLIDGKIEAEKLQKQANQETKNQISSGGETGNGKSTDSETTQALHRGGNGKPVNLTELKGDLQETKAMLERTGQTNTEEYRKTVASINAVEQQLSGKNNGYTGTNSLSKPTYSQTMRQTQREINRTNQAFDQAKDAWGSFAGQKQKNIEQARRELKRDEEEWKKQLAEKEERDRKWEIEEERKYRKNSKVTREYFNGLQQKTIEDFKFYRDKEKFANVTTEIKLYNVTKDKHEFFPSGRAYISLEKFIGLLPNLEELELTYYLGNTFPKNIKDLKKLKKLIFDTYSKVSISLVDGKLVARPNEEFVLPTGFFELENLEYLEFRFSTFTDDYTRYRTVIKFLDTDSFKKFKKLTVVKVTNSSFLPSTMFKQLVGNPSIEKIIIDETLEQFKWSKWDKKFLKKVLKYTPITFEFKDKVLKGKSSTNQLANQD